MYVGYKEALEAIKQGRKVNFYFLGQKVVLDKDSNMKDLYKRFGIQVTVNSVIDGKFIVI